MPLSKVRPEKQNTDHSYPDLERVEIFNPLFNSNVIQKLSYPQKFIFIRILKCVGPTTHHAYYAMSSKLIILYTMTSIPAIFAQVKDNRTIFKCMSRTNVM